MAFCCCMLLTNKFLMHPCQPFRSGPPHAYFDAPWGCPPGTTIKERWTQSTWLRFNLIPFQVLPKFEFWEYVYLCSVVINLCAYFSLQRNRSSLLSVYAYGSLLLPVASLIWAAIGHWRELTTLLLHKRHNAFLFGQPLPLLYYLFLTVALYINARGVACAFKLLRAWNEKGFKNK